jgi:short-subunit dehydrogenase
VKTILLSGASSGIGKAIAIALTEQGHQVWGTSRDVARLPQLPNFHPVALDLGDPNSIAAAFAAAVRDAGKLDVLINNAGSGHFGPAENLSTQTISTQFQLLVFGHIQLMQLALAAMRSQGHGLIINVTSLASRLPVPFMAAYNAAKAAMAAFTMSIQLELPDSQVTIVDLQPGDISTGFNDAISKTSSHDPRYEAKVPKTWEAVDRNMKAAPKPELVAWHVLKLIEQANPPPRITVGDVFQSKIAPLIFRLLPQRIGIWGLKKYYRL